MWKSQLRSVNLAYLFFSSHLLFCFILMMALFPLCVFTTTFYFHQFDWIWVFVFVFIFHNCYNDIAYALKQLISIGLFILNFEWFSSVKNIVLWFEFTCSETKSFVHRVYPIGFGFELSFIFYLYYLSLAIPPWNLKKLNWAISVFIHWFLNGFLIFCLSE